MCSIRLIEATLFSVNYGGPTRKSHSELARLAIFAGSAPLTQAMCFPSLCSIPQFRRKTPERKAGHRARIHRRRLSVLARLDRSYEHLVDLLCLAAQCNDVSRFRERYRKLRQALLFDYAVLRRHMLPLVQQHWPEISTTPFDYLLSAEEIDLLIDDTAIMDVMVNCRWLLDIAVGTMPRGR